MKKPAETALQSKCNIWLTNNYGLKFHSPRLSLMLIPNETASTVGGVMTGLGVPKTLVSKVVSQVMRTLISTGFYAGASDSILLAPNRVVFIEFKLPTNSQQPNQIEFEKHVTSLGHKYIVIKSLEAFQSFVINDVVSKYA